MLLVKGLSCGYGRKTVISAMNVEVAEGEFFGVIGPNGSGKTTLLRALSRAIKPIRGSILLKGKELWDIPLADVARQAAVVSQLVPRVPMTVEEFVLLGRIPHFERMQFVESARDIEIAHKSMALTDSLRLKDRPMDQLSGGERQLAQIARALAQEPKLLLLDEPTAHLDIRHQVVIMDLLKRLVRELKLTVVMVLHDLNLASEYCDRVALISDGQVFKAGTPAEVLDYQVIEAVYQTVVVVHKNPVSGKPYVLIVSEDELKKNRDAYTRGT
ncbi:MAG: ABC transporter ATP-binding protein [Candidatus Omnitrophica bacterium]|nr:ABC transporter ATP-binding protein [Candidatus Omnitrophota bacterium]